MAKHDRCTICDYSEQYGSNMMSLPPGANGKVRRYGNDFLCETCGLSIDEALVDPVDDEPVARKAYSLSEL